MFLFGPTRNDKFVFKLLFFAHIGEGVGGRKKKHGHQLGDLINHNEQKIILDTL